MLINGNVYSDYRDNIMIDKDNPVLAFKANRDRYSGNDNQKIYAGLSHIGSINSEDAITWNLIRTLSIINDFSSLEELIKIKLNSPKVLLWTLSFDKISNELQYLTGSTIRSIDGKHNGQITEPDIIIETDEYLLVFECKLGVKGEFPNHLWDSQKASKGPEVRKNDYFSNELFNSEALGYTDCAYQLYRMVFYTYEIAKRLNKKPVFISLVNKTWWEIKRGNISPNNIWNDFVSQVDKSKIDLINIFWQDIRIKNNNILAEYLLNHRCL